MGELDQVLDLSAFESSRVEAALQKEEELEKEHHHHHHNHNEIRSISLTSSRGDLDMTALSNFMYKLIHLNHSKLMRIKGILSVRGFDERLVVQSVGTAYKGEFGSPWGPDEQRTSRLV